MAEKKRKLSSLDDVNLDFNDGKTSSASSTLLRMASPVFDAMFTSGMDEEQTMRVQVEMPKSYHSLHVAFTELAERLALFQGVTVACYR